MRLAVLAMAEKSLFDRRETRRVVDDRSTINAPVLAGKHVHLGVNIVCVLFEY